MTRKHAALQLLRLGELTAREFVEITGWPRRVALYTLAWMVQTGAVEYVGTTQRGIYRVAP